MSRLTNFTCIVKALVKHFSGVMQSSIDTHIKMESSEEEKHNCYAIINNIPPEYHSKDLRNYFSQFIESKGFICFHFRHRPEAVTSAVSNESSTSTSDKRSSTCCVVKLSSERLSSFTKLYNKKHWVDTKGDVMRQACYVFKIRMPKDQGKGCH